ncbi:MAG: metallophosphoesterase [Bacilli bacterium]|jgi:hypothetical protein
MDYKKGFRILWLTDIHLGNPTNTYDYNEEKEYTHLRAMIENANNPDLIVLTGDVFERETIDQVDAFVAFIDSFNIKWAYTNGNHDPSVLIKDKFYINRKIMAAKNSLFVDYENDDLYGLTNYFINLVSNNKTVYRLYMVDSNSAEPMDSIKGDSDADVIHLDQLQHITKINQDQANNAAGLSFFHIPLREYVNAYQGYSDKLYDGFGAKKDNIGYGYVNNGAYTVMKEAGVIATFAGHNHGNDFDVDYFDDDNHMVLSCGLKGTDLNYYDPDLVGYKVITLPEDPTTFTHKNIAETKFGY